MNIWETFRADLKFFTQRVEDFLKWVAFFQEWRLFSLRSHLWCEHKGHSSPDQTQYNYGDPHFIDRAVPSSVKEFFNPRLLWLINLLDDLNFIFITLFAAVFRAAPTTFCEFILNIVLVVDNGRRHNHYNKEEINWDKDTSEDSERSDWHDWAEGIRKESHSSSA